MPPTSAIPTPHRLLLLLFMCIFASILGGYAFPLPFPESPPPSSNSNDVTTGITPPGSEIVAGTFVKVEGNEGERKPDRHRSSRPLHLVADDPSSSTSPSSVTSTSTTSGIASIPLIQRPISPSYVQRIQAQYAQYAKYRDSQSATGSAFGRARSSTGGIPGWNPLWGIGPVVPPYRLNLPLPLDHPHTTDTQGNDAGTDEVNADVDRDANESGGG